MNYTFDQVKEAVQSCTGYDLVEVVDDDCDELALVDPYGDQVGDSFQYLEDVIDYVSDNEQVNEYLKTNFNQPEPVKKRATIGWLEPEPAYPFTFKELKKQLNWKEELYDEDHSGTVLVSQAAFDLYPEIHSIVEDNEFDEDLVEKYPYAIDISHCVGYVDQEGKEHGFINDSPYSEEHWCWVHGVPYSFFYEDEDDVYAVSWADG